MSSLVSTRSRSAQLWGGVIATALTMSLLGSAAVQAAPGKRQNGKARPALTQVKLRLDAHSYVAGDSVTGIVTVKSGNGRNRAPLSGADVSVRVDGVDLGTVTTGGDGTAVVSLIAEEGEHAVKVAYAGDAGHKKSQHAQGYEATAAEEVVEDPPVEEPLPEEGTTTP